MRFTPSVYSGYGADDQAPSEGEAGYEQYLEQYGPAVMKLLVGKTARERYEILKAKIANQKKLYKSTRNRFFKNIIAGNINKLQAQLRAVRYELGEEQETAEWLRYSKGLTLAGGLLGVGLASLLAIEAIRTLGAVRKAQEQK